MEKPIIIGGCPWWFPSIPTYNKSTQQLLQCSMCVCSQYPKVKVLAPHAYCITIQLTLVTDRHNHNNKCMSSASSCPRGEVEGFLLCHHFSNQYTILSPTSSNTYSLHTFPSSSATFLSSPPFSSLTSINSSIHTPAPTIPLTSTNTACLGQIPHIQPRNGPHPPQLHYHTLQLICALLNNIHVHVFCVHTYIYIYTIV